MQKRLKELFKIKDEIFNTFEVFLVLDVFQWLESKGGTSYIINNLIEPKTYGRIPALQQYSLRYGIE